MEDLAHSMDFCSINNHHRTIIHIDIDCFYAQVEMIKNPALRDCPLGIQQKNIIVTSNYIAREFGIQKCMLVTEGLKLCPQLVLVRGEDLQDYRTVSTRITNLLHKYTPHVEKLGLDEDFIDVTDLVAERLEKGVAKSFLVGHAYGDLNEQCECGCIDRLSIGSHIASEIRKDIRDELGLSCCAGIAHNKLLAKLVGSTHKPDQQTTIFPCNATGLLSGLSSVRGIPGVGHRMEEKLQTLGISSVEDIRNCNLTSLQCALGQDIAVHIKKLSYGIDDTPVKQSGKPQSIGLEDGFRKISLESEVKEKFSVLLQRLLKLLSQDGRIPGAIKVTVRKYDTARKYSHRESRQCNVSPSIFMNRTCNILKESLSPKANEKLMNLILQLFHKIVDISKPFHLTLLGLAFTKFREQKTGRGSIASFLTKDICVQSVLNFKSVSDGGDEKMECASTSSSPCISVTNSSPKVCLEKSGSESEPEPSPKKSRTTLWRGICKKRLSSEEDEECSPNKRLSEGGDSSDSMMSQDFCENMSTNTSANGASIGECSNIEIDDECSSKPNVSEIENRFELLQCPDNVDKDVFSALPEDLKNELLEAWQLEKTERIPCSQPKFPISTDPRQKSIKDFFITK